MDESESIEVAIIKGKLIEYDYTTIAYHPENLNKYSYLGEGTFPNDDGRIYHFWKLKENQLPKNPSPWNLKEQLYEIC